MKWKNRIVHDEFYVSDKKNCNKNRTTKNNLIKTMIFQTIG